MIKPNVKLTPAKTAKKNSRYYDAKSLLGWRKYNPGPEWGENIANILLEWSEDERYTDMIEFFVWFGIPKRSYYDLKKKYPILQEAHDMVILRFAIRRDLAARNRSQDSKTIIPTLHLYHPTWKKCIDEEREFRRELASIKDKTNTPTEITVIMESFGEEQGDKKAALCNYKPDLPVKEAIREKNRMSKHS